MSLLMLGQKEVKKGKKREKRLTKEYAQKGFQVLNAKHYNTGVDILAIDPKTGRIKEAVESTNYRSGNYIDIKRARRYANSLSKFPYAKKTLVISFDNNLGKQARRILASKGVNIRVEGYQD